MNLDANVRLWASREARSVNLLRNGQLELAWDRIIVPLRQADLIVLNTTLQQWMSEPEREWAETYLLSLNECNILIKADDLYHFCAMIAEGVEQLHRTFVRWADLDVRIVPFTTELSHNSGYFYFN